jgi:hypothetical protein
MINVEHVGQCDPLFVVGITALVAITDQRLLAKYLPTRIDINPTIWVWCWVVILVGLM